MQGTTIQLLLKRFLLLVSLGCCGAMASAQSEDIFIYGQIKDSETLKKLDGVTVEILKDGTLFDTYDAGASGKYEFYAPLGSNYDIRFYREGFINKMVRIDTRNIPEEDRKGGFKLNMDMTLFAYVEGFNTDILKEPIGKAGFDSVKNSIEFDFNYTEKIQAKIDAEFKRLKDLEANMEKLQKEFEDLMLKGDQKMLEKKYQEAMGKFESALKIFPDNKTAQEKYKNAKAKYDEEQLGKELEARYAKLMSDGDKNMKAKSWDQAKENFTQASNLKPAERLPKDKLAEIDKILASLVDKEKYDKLIKDADAKFASADYAVCIAQYTEASNIIPSEVYPKSQIAKAKQLLDAMLSDEQARLELERKYKDMITLGDRNMKDKSYETARQNFQEASILKPDEKYPKDKISELDKLIAELNAKKDKNAQDLLADEEKARRDKEYQDHVDQGNTLFEQSKLSESKAEYEAALVIKPTEKYPRTRISRIDELLAAQAKNDKKNSNDGMSEEERKQQEALARQELEDKAKKAEEERQARIDNERLEHERIAQERLRKEEEERKKRNAFMNNVDKAHEDEVETYMREARESEDQAKYNRIKQDVDEYGSFLSSRQEEFDGVTSQNMEAVNNRRDQLDKIRRNGEILHSVSANDSENQRAQAEKLQRESQEKADRQRTDAYQKVQETRQQSLETEVLDQNRLSNVSAIEDQKDKFQDQQNSMIKRGDALRKDGQYDVKKKQDQQKNQEIRGEDVRQENIREVDSKLEDLQHRSDDISSAAKERTAVAYQRTEQKKDAALELSESKKNSTQENISKVNQQHQQGEMFLLEHESKAAADRYEKRNDLFDKNSGQPKSEDDYHSLPGTENLPEGVTENSYQLGNNKIVIERTVKVGNKVDFFRKVISKSATYYFKNGQSITELVWDQETLKNHN